MMKLFIVLCWSILIFLMLDNVIIPMLNEANTVFNVLGVILCFCLLGGTILIVKRLTK